MTKENIVPLSNKDHRDITYIPINNYSFTANMLIAPLLPFEVPQASPFFPIIFKDEYGVTPHVLLGLKNSNVFVDEKGRWKAPYLPLTIHNYPFSLMQAKFSEENGQDDKTIEVAIAIDKEAPHFKQQKGYRLFTDDGKPTEVLTQIKNTLINQYKGYVNFEKSLKNLSYFDVIKEQVVTISYEGKEKKIGGLHCVNKEKLFALSDETLASFVRNGVMELVFAHWQSLRNLRLLVENASQPQYTMSNLVQDKKIVYN